MAKITKIILQQMVAMDQTSITASRYPRYTVVLGNSISSITAGELTASVDAAAASAAAAKESEIAAKDSEINAKNSEQEAAISEQNAETSASQSAKSAADSLLEAGKSAASATESANSAVSAGEFRDSAEFSAQNAERSKDLADQAKVAAEEAARQSALSATESTNQATAAAGSATEAGDYAAAAKASELAAKESETNAAGSATTAGDKAVASTAEADRAKAEADRAMQVVDGKLDKNDISGFIKTYKTLEAAEADVANRVLGEKILVWSKTNSRYGWYKVAGTAEAPILELESEESKLLSVNNVQPDEYGNVQVTLPGGNPSLWLGEVTWFPYDKDSGIGYSGVLPADGREVLRVDYPDTWEAIEAGLIPSVSEAEWQAGSKLYFSTGNGTTTFRLPDMMQGQAFRAASKDEDNAGAIHEQVPYVATVNNAAPDDMGNVIVKIKGTELTDAVPISNGGTGGTTPAGARTGIEVDRFKQSPTETRITSNNVQKWISIGDSGVWGGYDNTAGKWLALGVAQGGTGNTTADGARVTFKVDRLLQETDFTDLYSASKARGLRLHDTAEWGVRNTDGSGWIALGVGQGGTGAITPGGARTNLELDRFLQFSAAGETQMKTKSGQYQLYVKDTGAWGVWDNTNNVAVPLGVNYGGTGATDVAGARSNLLTDRFHQDPAETITYSPNKRNYLSIKDSGTGWGVYSLDSGWVPLGVAQGGTGGKTAENASMSLHTWIVSSGSTVGNSTDMNTLEFLSSGNAGLNRPIGASDPSTMGNWPSTARKNANLYGYGGLQSVAYNLSGGVQSQMYMSHRGDLSWRMKWGGGWGDPWHTAWHSHNTTVDSNGFLKAASPIVKIFTDGSFETNEESAGAYVERISTGVYKVYNVLGLNSDAGWGGPEGGFEIPIDRNQNPTLWLDYSVEADGSILVKTYHRTNPDAPDFAKNLIGHLVDGVFVETVKNGEAIDIPEGVFISIRVQMPEDSAYNLSLREAERLAKEEAEKEQIVTSPEGSEGNNEENIVNKRQDEEIEELRKEIAQLKDLIASLLTTPAPTSK